MSSWWLQAKATDTTTESTESSEQETPWFYNPANDLFLRSLRQEAQRIKESQISKSDEASLDYKREPKDVSAAEDAPAENSRKRPLILKETDGEETDYAEFDNEVGAPTLCESTQCQDEVPTAVAEKNASMENEVARLIRNNKTVTKLLEELETVALDLGSKLYTLGRLEWYVRKCPHGVTLKMYTDACDECTREGASGHDFHPRFVAGGTLRALFYVGRKWMDAAHVTNPEITGVPESTSLSAHPDTEDAVSGCTVSGANDTTTARVIEPCADRVVDSLEDYYDLPNGNLQKKTRIVLRKVMKAVAAVDGISRRLKNSLRIMRTCPHGKYFKRKETTCRTCFEQSLCHDTSRTCYIQQEVHYNWPLQVLRLAEDGILLWKNAGIMKDAATRQVACIRKILKS